MVLVRGVMWSIRRENIMGAWTYGLSYPKQSRTIHKHTCAFYLLVCYIRRLYDFLSIHLQQIFNKKIQERQHQTPRGNILQSLFTTPDRYKQTTFYRYGPRSSPPRKLEHTYHTTIHTYKGTSLLTSTAGVHIIHINIKNTVLQSVSPRKKTMEQTKKKSAANFHGFFVFPNLSFKDHFQLIIGILLSPTFPAGKRLVRKDSDKKIPPAKKESPIEKAPSLGANCEFLAGGRCDSQLKGNHEPPWWDVWIWFCIEAFASRPGRDLDRRVRSCL